MDRTLTILAFLVGTIAAAGFATNPLPVYFIGGMCWMSGVLGLLSGGRKV